MVNRMRFTLATAPATEPITAAEVYAQCRINTAEQTSDATYVGTLITAARIQAENLVGPIYTQAWDGYIDSWPCDGTITIEKPRVTAITSVKYTIVDASAATTLAATEYLTDFVSYYARIRLANGSSWPSDTLEVINPIVIRFSAGWASAAATPAALKQAILFLASHWYNNREMVYDGQVAEIPQTFTDLISSYREWGV